MPERGIFLPVHLDASRHTKAKYSNQLARLSGVTTVGANHRIGEKNTAASASMSTCGRGIVH